MTAPVDTSPAHAAVSVPAAPTAPAMGYTYANSTASDAPSLASVAPFTTTSPIVANVKPAPEYISLSSASQLATDVADARADEDHSWRLHHRATVAESAVASINQFLDRQLYEYIGAARTTSLKALKPAVTEVLKKNLARDAIASAEDNLEDLLALQADDEFNDESRPSSQSSAKFNLDFTWKRSRLRVMMRSEKSEFDIDDDERYVREEGLNTTFSETAGVISLASEIFLAGVLDYLGEMLLSMASQVTLSRIQRAGASSNLSGNSDDVTYILVDDADLERAVLNSPLDRQWRAWKKSLRILNRASQQSHSVTSSPVTVRRGSLWDRIPDRPENSYSEHVLASNIPLPENQRDVDEIEVPGLAKDPDRPASAQQSFHLPRSYRPQSAGFAAHRQYESENLAKTRPVSVPLPMTTPLVEAPGPWPTDTPFVEIVDPSSQYAEGQAGEGLPSVQMDDSERPESRDSAHTEKASVSSQPTSLNEPPLAMKIVQRPKRLAIYGPSSARYTQAFNLSQEGLELAADLDRPFSPEDFLASRNLSGSHSGLTPTSSHSKPQVLGSPAELAAETFMESDSGSDTENDPEPIVHTALSSPVIATSPLARQFPGLGISRSGSDASSRRERTPISEQRVSADFVKTRRTSKLTDSDSSSPGKRGSLRQVSRQSVDERKKLPTSSMTSEKDFDALLQRDETIKYTLTPENVRDSSDRVFSPQTRARKPTLFRSDSRDNSKKDSDNSPRSNSANRSFGAGGQKKDPKPVEEARRKTSISRPSPQNLHALPSGQIAREAVMQTESTRDLADFFRSTAPEREPNPIVPGLATSRSLSSIRATAQAQAASARDAPPVPKSTTSGGKYIPRSPAGPPPKRSANRPNLTARAATGSSDNNSDLIDFIRGGPPGPDGKARVPTHIAPFADWDGGASEVPPNSSLNRPLTSSTSDSRTGLLMNGTSNTNYGSSSTPKLPMSPLTQPGSSGLNLLLPNTRPVVGSDGRTRSRIKDPYAIPDDSDDDYDEDDVLAALPATVSNGATVAGAEKSQPGSMTAMHSSAGRSPALSNSATPTLSPNPGYAPSINSVRSNTSTSAVRPAHITSQISSGNIPRSNKPKMEVRSAGVVRNARLDPFHSSGTSDLADFLMSSGPPEPIQRPAPAPAVGKNGKPEKAEKKKSKFWQRSSSAKNTYVDMP
ncbi:hypothetical protein QM012_002637 [Aureobasidium pullulans]|uniref:Uncharacterized protein n=1 Tax=Aureobasidium pullulans TaxID=5580 RepID=A0ABR0TA41_AURPU